MINKKVSYTIRLPLRYITTVTHAAGFINVYIVCFTNTVSIVMLSTVVF